MKRLPGRKKLDVDLRFVVFIALLILVAVYVYFKFAGQNPNMDADRVTVHIRIDDEAIDRGDAWSIVEPVWWNVEIHKGVAEYEQTLARFSREQRLLSAVFWYTSEVDNGGHDQFYSNSTGIVWKDALAGFREMGVEEAAAILEESARRVGGNPSLDRKTRYEQLESLHPVFDDLDQRYFEADKRINLAGIMWDYIRKHRAAFYFEGDVTMPKTLAEQRRGAP